MKLSFSFAKTAAPKRSPVQAQVVQELDIKREILEVSAESGVITEPTKLDVSADDHTHLIIPCKSHYHRPEKIQSAEDHIHDSELQQMRDKPGLLPVSATQANNGTFPVPKKQRTSILMQIREARARGEVKDAPDEAVHKYDAEEFAWGLLRGMGYDESKDTGPDVTKDVVGNRSKLGLGVKLDSIKLPTDRSNKA